MKQRACSRQIFVMSIISVLGFGIFSMAHTVSKYMSTSSWIAIFLASIIFLIPTIVLSVLAKKYTGSTFFDYSKKVVGEKLGTVFSGIYALFYMLFTALIISYFSHIATSWILPNVNFRIVASFIVLVCAYSMFCGFASILNLVSFVGIISILSVIAVRSCMIFSSDMTSLLPIYEASVVNEGLLSALTSISIFFFGIGTLCIIPNDNPKKSYTLSAASGLLVAAAILVLVCAACFCVLGVLSTSIHADSVVLSMKSFDISRTTFIQRADIIFIITWTLLILCTVCSISHIPYVFIKTMLPKKRSGIFAGLMCVLIFAISNIAPDMESALKYITFLCQTLGVISLFVLPIIILIVSEVKRRNEK